MIAYYLFLCGFFYYCIMPLAVVKLNPDNVALGFIKSNYTDAVLIEYFICAMIFICFFSAGFFVKFRSKKIIKLKDPKISSLFSIVLAGIYAFLFLNIFSANEVMNMVGYLDGYDIERRGRLSTLFLTSIWWYIYIQPLAKFKLLKNFFGLVVIFSGLNLLALGSRLAVVTGVVMILLNNYPNLFLRPKINLSLVLIGILFVAGFFGVVGVLREASELNFEAIIFIIFAEPYSKRELDLYQLHE